MIDDHVPVFVAEKLTVKICYHISVFIRDLFPRTILHPIGHPALRFRSGERVHPLPRIRPIGNSNIHKTLRFKLDEHISEFVVFIVYRINFQPRIFTPLSQKSLLCPLRHSLDMLFLGIKRGRASRKPQYHRPKHGAGKQHCTDLFHPRPLCPTNLCTICIKHITTSAFVKYFSKNVVCSKIRCRNRKNKKRIPFRDPSPYFILS